MARLAHDLSGRSGRLVKVDCPAMTESLIESELFGHEKGAYTGAGSRHVGLIEEAQGGTVFFDEFGELPQRVQVKLLCLLQDRCIRRVGSTRPIEVDVLVVAATNRDLDAMVACEQFRDDLIYRFDEQIVIPPLRLRRDDIALLAERFLQQECEKLARRIEQAMQRERTPIPAPANVTSNNQRSRLQFAFSEAARDRLARYDYPGNVRELQKIVSKAVGASLSPLVAGMEFRIAFERLTIDEKAVADAIEATMPCIERLEARIRAEFKALEAQSPPPTFSTMEQALAERLAPRKFTLVLLVAFAALAGGLAIIGLYSVLSYLVAERTREIGIRIAVGANPARVSRMVLGQGLLLTLIGIAAGGILSIAAVRVLRAWMYEMSVYDAPTFAAVAALLVVVALVASWLPARRASRVDPVQALRAE